MNNKIEKLLSVYVDLMQLNKTSLALELRKDLDKAVKELLHKEKYSEDLMKTYYLLNQLEFRELSRELEEKLNEHIEFVEKEDWTKHQICGDFPRVDPRCLVFCCSPTKNCPYRNSVLRKMGLRVEDYIKMKEEFAEQIKR